jgi:peptidyl-prolyl cis-trans isomerase SDCCAG10
VLAALDSFRGMLKASRLDDVTLPDGSTAEAGEDGVEVDTDTGFLTHALTFPKDNTEEVNKAEREYEVIDPRVRGARAKQEERDRKNASKSARGGRRR